MTQPIAGPWLSPKVVTERSLPKVLLDTCPTCVAERTNFSNRIWLLLEPPRSPCPLRDGGREAALRVRLPARIAPGHHRVERGQQHLRLMQRQQQMRAVAFG